VAKYRMEVYEAGEVLWQTHDIHASDDYEALAKALDMYVDLATEPNATALDRFVLSDEANRLVHEIRSRDLPRLR